MSLIVDSSSWISYFAGRRADEVIDEALAVGQVVMAPIVAAELLSGRLSRTERRDLQALLQALPWCQTDVAHWFRVGELRHMLRRQGLSVSTPDAHVARCALDLDAFLLSEDAIFRKIAPHCGLQIYT